MRTQPKLSNLRTVGRFRPWARLRWQLILAFVPLIVIPIFATQLVARGVTEQGVKLLITERAQRRAQDLAARAAIYYSETGSWEGVTQVAFIPPWIPLLRNLRGDVIVDSNTKDFMRMTSPEQVLIADTGGKVVAGDGSAPVGVAISPTVLDRGAPILVNGLAVGTLVIGEALGLLTEQQQDVIGAINGALLASGAVSAALALAMGLYLSWQITRPARELMRGVQRLHGGAWDGPLNVTAQNEFGDLTHAFNDMATEITRQERLRRQMVADVAHDLRTPLTAMLLEVEALGAGMQSQETTAANLREEIGWLQRLVEDLRLLSLLDADQLTIKPQPTALAPFLTSLHDFFEPLAIDQGRTFTLDLVPALSAVCIDSGRMRQVIANLFDNALRHTHPGGMVTLRARLDGDYTLIQMIDDGEGIAQSDLPHIFERFYRADRSRSHESNLPERAPTGGSGLGLSIAQKLSELHGGALTVSSVPGHGATFTLRLPIIATVSTPPIVSTQPVLAASR